MFRGSRAMVPRPRLIASRKFVGRRVVPSSSRVKQGSCHGRGLPESGPRANWHSNCKTGNRGGPPGLLCSRWYRDRPRGLSLESGAKSQVLPTAQQERETCSASGVSSEPDYDLRLGCSFPSCCRIPVAQSGGKEAYAVMTTAKEIKDGRRQSDACGR